MTAIPTVGTGPSDTIDTQRQSLNLAIARWNNLGTYDDIVVTGGIIDGTIIGSTVAAAGTFTNITATGTVDLSGADAFITSAGLISGNSISGGTITSTAVTLSADPPSANYATRKSYVDTAISTLSGSLSSVATSGDYGDLVNKPNIFQSIIVATQTTVTANSGSTALTFVAGSNVSITTDNTTKTVSFAVNGLGTLAFLSAINNSNWSGTALSIANGGTGATSQGAAQTALGIGSVGLLNSINNSNWSGTALAVTNGGTGATSAGTAATALGLGTSSLVQLGSLGIGVTAPANAGNLQVNKSATFASEVANGTKTLNFTVDWSQGNKQSVVLGASSLQMSFTNPIGPCHLQLRIIQDGSGSRTKGTWPTIKSPSNSLSTTALSTGTNAVDILNLYFDGTNYWGQLSLNWTS